MIITTAEVENSLMNEFLRLRGITGDVKDKIWESESLLRAGRLCTLEIVLDDSSVSREHADVYKLDGNWWVRDLDSTNGTYVNGVRLENVERQLHARDIIQFGKVAMVVELDEKIDMPIDENAHGAQTSPILTLGRIVNSSWEDCLQRLVFGRDDQRRPSDLLTAASRARQHLATCRNEEELLNSVLKDAISILDAQRGMILIADAPDGAFGTAKIGLAAMREQWRRMLPVRQRPKVAERCFRQCESVLLWDSTPLVEPKADWNCFVPAPTLPAFLCVLLHTQHKRLGVLFLERGTWSPEFNEDDLHLADGLAAYLSTGITCAHSSVADAHVDPLAPPENLRSDPLGQLILNTARPAYEQIPPDPRWLTSDVVDLAKAIRSERAFDRMPILADALMNAGCDSNEMLGHCRESGFHVGGCWVLDLLLGNG